MIKQWIPILDDIKCEIVRLKARIEDIPFDSEFPSRCQLVKLRTNELSERLGVTIQEIKSEAAAEREQIDLMMAEFRRDVKTVQAMISDLRITRAHRGHANYLHCLALKAQSEEGGEV